MNIQKKIDKSIKCVFELLSETNAYIDTEAPWNLKNTNKDRMNDVLFLTLNIIKNSSIMLIPVMPESANKILDILNVNKIERNFDRIAKGEEILSLSSNSCFEKFPMQGKVLSCWKDGRKIY